MPCLPGRRSRRLKFARCLRQAAGGGAKQPTDQNVTQQPSKNQQGKQKNKQKQLNNLKCSCFLAQPWPQPRTSAPARRRTLQRPPSRRRSPRPSSAAAWLSQTHRPPKTDQTKPVNQHTKQPSDHATQRPSNPATKQPSDQASKQASKQATNHPPTHPTNRPTNQATKQPSDQPTQRPTNQTHPCNQ